MGVRTDVECQDTVVGQHLAHHVDMGVPWRNLPRLHDELVRAGWVTPEAVTDLVAERTPAFALAPFSIERF